MTCLLNKVHRISFEIFSLIPKKGDHHERFFKIDWGKGVR